MAVWGQVVYLGIAFLVIFTGVNVFQTLLAAEFPESGPVLIAVNYAAYAVGSYFAPRSSVERISEDDHFKRRVVWALAAFTYPIWILCFVISRSVWFYYFTSVLNGLGSGLLWAIQGIWFADLCRAKYDESKDQIGFWNGIFFAIYQLAAFIGNTVALISIYVLADSKSNLLEYILASFSAVGACMILFMPKTWISPFHPMLPRKLEKHEEKKSCSRMFALHKANVKELWTQTRFPLLVVVIVEYAMLNAFAWISVAIKAGSYSTKFEASGYPANFLLLVTFSVYGAVSVFAYAFLGRIIERIVSLKKLLLISYFGISLPVGICFALDVPAKLQISSLVAFFSISAGFLSIAVSIFTSVVTISIAKGMMHQNNAEAFSHYHAIYCITYGLFSLVQVKLQVELMALVIIACAPLSLVAFYFFENKRQNMDQIAIEFADEKTQEENGEKH
jgi:MFS family permease